MAIDRTAHATSTLYFGSRSKIRNLGLDRYGSLGNIKTQHEELAEDVRWPPSWGLGNYPEHQLPDFFRRRLSPDARPGSRDQPPVQTESGLVPADYGFGRDDEEGKLPSRLDRPSNYREELIDEVEARARMSTLQNGELLA
jgi:hypothetical protein